jgi:hypothetical protein
MGYLRQIVHLERSLGQVVKEGVVYFLIFAGLSALGYAIYMWVAAPTVSEGDLIT